VLNKVKHEHLGSFGGAQELLPRRYVAYMPVDRSLHLRDAKHHGKPPSENHQMSSEAKKDSANPLQPLTPTRITGEVLGGCHRYVTGSGDIAGNEDVGNPLPVHWLELPDATAVYIPATDLACACSNIKGQTRGGRRWMDAVPQTRKTPGSGPNPVQVFRKETALDRWGCRPLSSTNPHRRRLGAS
jgi:hypothetical protein